MDTYTSEDIRNAWEEGFDAGVASLDEVLVTVHAAYRLGQIAYLQEKVPGYLPDCIKKSDTLTVQSFRIGYSDAEAYSLSH